MEEITVVDEGPVKLEDDAHSGKEEAHAESVRVHKALEAGVSTGTVVVDH